MDEAHLPPHPGYNEDGEELVEMEIDYQERLPNAVEDDEDHISMSAPEDDEAGLVRPSKGTQRKYVSPWTRVCDTLLTIGWVDRLSKAFWESALMQRVLPYRKAGPTLPWGYIIIVYFAVMCDALSITVVQPFLPDMCRERFKLSEEWIGTWVGIIVGVFPAARFLSSSYIGHLTDKTGRKYVLIFGLAISFLSTALFGAAPNVWVAVLIRFTGGFLTSTETICRSILSDLSAGDLVSERAVIFAYLGASFALSRSLSSSLGGLVASIKTDLIDPFLLASLVASSLPLLSFVMSVVFLPETHPLKVNGGQSQAVSSQPRTQGSGLWYGLKEMAKDPVMRKLMIMNAFNAFGNGGVLLAFVLIASAKVEDRGWGFTSAETGLAFMAFGLCGFLFQILFFKRISRRLGLRKQYAAGCLTIGLACLMVPLASFPYWIWGKTSTTWVLVWGLIVVSAFVLSIGFMSVLPILQSMLTNSLDASRQGLGQGTAQGVASLLRAVGPVACGMLFSAFLSIKLPLLLFVLLAVTYIITMIMAPTLPPELDMKKEEKVTVKDEPEDKEEEEELQQVRVEQSEDKEVV